MKTRVLALVVDDDKDIQSVAQLSLEIVSSISNERVSIAGDAETAISKISEIIGTSSHDVATKVILILDGNFPDLGGLNLGYKDVLDALIPLLGTNLTWYLICNSGERNYNQDMKQKASEIDKLMKRSDPNTGMIVLSDQGKPNAILDGLKNFHSFS